jgi:hypothetical protein
MGDPRGDVWGEIGTASTGAAVARQRVERGCVQENAEKSGLSLSENSLVWLLGGRGKANEKIDKRLGGDCPSARSICLPQVARRRGESLTEVFSIFCVGGWFEAKSKKLREEGMSWMLILPRVLFENEGRNVVLYRPHRHGCIRGETSLTNSSGASRTSSFGWLWCAAVGAGIPLSHTQR